MRRGPAPAKGMGHALEVAGCRGLVMVFQPSKKNIATFVIVGNGTFAIVSLHFTERLWPDSEEIAFRNRDVIVSLGLVPFVGPVSRELWLYNRHDTLRFFRLGATGLIGNDEHGIAQVTGNAADMQTGAALSGRPGAHRGSPVIPGTTAPVSGQVATGSDQSSSSQTAVPVVAPQEKTSGPNPVGPTATGQKKTAGKKPAAGKTARIKPVVTPKETRESAAGSPAPVDGPVPLPGAGPADPPGSPESPGKETEISPGEGIPGEGI